MRCREERMTESVNDAKCKGQFSDEIEYSLFRHVQSINDTQSKTVDSG